MIRMPKRHILGSCSHSRHHLGQNECEGGCREIGKGRDWAWVVEERKNQSVFAIYKGRQGWN